MGMNGASLAKRSCIRAAETRHLHIQENTAGLLVVAKLRKKLGRGFVKRNLIASCLEDPPDSCSKQGIIIDDMNDCRQGGISKERSSLAMSGFPVSGRRDHEAVEIRPAADDVTIVVIAKTKSPLTSLRLSGLDLDQSTRLRAVGMCRLA